MIKLSVTVGFHHSQSRDIRVLSAALRTCQNKVQLTSFSFSLHQTTFRKLLILASAELCRFVFILWINSDLFSCSVFVFRASDTRDRSDLDHSCSSSSQRADREASAATSSLKETQQTASNCGSIDGSSHRLLIDLNLITRAAARTSCPHNLNMKSEIHLPVVAPREAERRGETRGVRVCAGLCGSCVRSCVRVSAVLCAVLCAVSGLLVGLTDLLLVTKPETGSELQDSSGPPRVAESGTNASTGLL